MSNCGRVLCAAVVSVTLMLGGCKSSSSPTEGARKFTVIFSQCNNAEPYRAAQNDLMARLWAQYPDVQFSILDAQQDDKKQIDQITTAIRQKPDLLIVAPNQRAPLTRVMGEAMRADIPVICLERDIVEPHYTTYIRCDNYAIGKMAGQFIVEHLKKKYGAPKGNIVQLQGLLGVEGEINRNNGAADVLKVYPDIKYVHTAVADWIQSKAKDRMIEALNANPQIDIVYAHNDPMAIGAYLAAREKSREKEMIFIGVDGLGGEQGGIKKVVDGVLAATFVYPLCVDKAVEIGNSILRNKDFKPQKEYVMTSTAVTPENAAELLKKTAN